MKYIDQLNLKGKTVFIRADLNVPFTKTGEVADDNRITASLPTIKFALDNGAKVVLASHLGRPKGKPDPKYSLKPVAKRVEELARVSVHMADDCIGPAVEAAAKNLKVGEILLLENLRFHKEEEENEPEFSRKLANLAEVYVNDAFATAHRAHASTAGITKFFTEKGGGFTMKAELEFFAKAMVRPERPLAVIFGGAKVSTKMAAIKHVGERADKIIIGGAMANTFFAAVGLKVGSSLYEAEQLSAAQKIRKHLEEAGCRLMLPVDVVVAREAKTGAETKVVPIDQIADGWSALDIGPKTVELIIKALDDAKTIVWNGPMGMFEIEEFSAGTFRLAEALGKSKALTVVGGGDTDLALHQAHVFDKMGYVSTAGGAFLELLEGKSLPAVMALDT